METKTMYFHFALLLSAEAVLNEAYEYRFEYASYVTEVQDSISDPPADLYICQLRPGPKLEICKKAIEHPLVEKSQIKLVHRPIVDKKKIYAFSLTGHNNIGKPALISAACMCTTSPPVYLRDNSSGNFVEVYVSFRDFYVNHILSRPNFSFTFKHVVYARATKLEVKDQNTKLQVCTLEDDEKLTLCRAAVATTFLTNYDVRYLEDAFGSPVLEERMYEIKLADFEYMFEKPFMMAACMCPTMPHIYLEDRYVGESISVYVILRDELMMYEIGLSD